MNGGWSMQRGAVFPLQGEAAVGDHAIDADEVATAVLRAVFRSRCLRREREQRNAFTIKLAEIVKDELRFSEQIKGATDLLIRVQVAKQAVPDALFWEATELLLDAFEDGGGIAMGRQLEQERIESGEPADGLGQVDVWKQVNASVSLKVEEQGRMLSPFGEGEQEGGEEHVLNAGLVGVRHLLKQGTGLLSRKRDRNNLTLCLQILSLRLVEREGRSGRGVLGEPEGKLLAKGVGVGVDIAKQGVAPLPERRAGWW